MRIAFYAPMKPPDHAVPSGDRLMGNLLINALRRAGHTVDLASRLRVRSPVADGEVLGALMADAAIEAGQIGEGWKGGGRPDLWLSYHNYYKAPDLLGPQLCRCFGVPYATVEASYAGKRDRDAWRPWQERSADGIRHAAVNVCFTPRDAEGLGRIVAGDRLALLPPFIETADLPRPAARSARPVRLVTVAMMRGGYKLDSYRFLASALKGLLDLDWRLTVIGDGAHRDDVHSAFASLPPVRTEWLGRLERADVLARLAGADLFVWPGLSEPIGLSYLEAQGIGLPVVAVDSGGVGSVVESGRTGLLTSENPGEYGAAIRRLVTDDAMRAQMSAAAAAFVRDDRCLERAGPRLSAILEAAIRPRSAA